MIKLSDERKELCELRRCRKALGVFGKGIVIFTIWETIRNSMNIFLNDESMNVLDSEVEQSGMGMAAYLLAFYSLIFLNLAVRFFTARAAVRDAKGLKKHKLRVYIPVCICMVLITVYSLFLSFTGDSFAGGLFGTIVSFLLDMADVYTITSVIYYSNKIKKLNKLLGEEVN